MKCAICKKTIKGIQIFGNTREEKCFTCWMDTEMIGDNPDDDKNSHCPGRRELGKIIRCPSCRATSKKKDGEENCYKCKGVGKLIGQICAECEGYGELDHNCDCEVCEADTIDCRCINGVAFVAFSLPVARGIDYRFSFVHNHATQELGTAPATASA